MQQHTETTFGTPIAPGLFEIGGNHFRPDVLKNGTEDEQTREKMNWQLGHNVSIYIGWVPDELIPMKDEPEGAAHKFFGTFGKVNRIEFVPKFNAQRKQIGNMAFVHFDAFYVTEPLAQNIAEAHPAPYELPWYYTNRFGSRKEYKLKCCINLTPIRKVEYNASQLTDMFERLNTRVMKRMEDMQQTIDRLQYEISHLRNGSVRPPPEYKFSDPDEVPIAPGL
jgi:hypothetical protein